MMYHRRPRMYFGLCGEAVTCRAGARVVPEIQPYERRTECHYLGAARAPALPRSLRRISFAASRSIEFAQLDVTKDPALVRRLEDDGACTGRRVDDRPRESAVDGE